MSHAVCGGTPTQALSRFSDVMLAMFSVVRASPLASVVTAVDASVPEPIITWNSTRRPDRGAPLPTTRTSSGTEAAVFLAMYIFGGAAETASGDATPVTVAETLAPPLSDAVSITAPAFFTSSHAEASPVASVPTVQSRVPHGSSSTPLLGEEKRTAAPDTGVVLSLANTRTRNGLGAGVPTGTGGLP